MGVDADKQAIECLKRKGIQELACADVQAPGAFKIPEIKKPVDVVVAGELLEHLPNPGMCLKNIAELMDKQRSILLVTVPNAFSLRNFFSVLLRNNELVPRRPQLLLFLHEHQTSAEQLWLFDS